MKLHPLHSAEFVADFIKSTGEYFDTERCTGRTTALAFEHMSKAIQNPHKWIPVIDHHNTVMAGANLAALIAQYVYKLGLKHFTVAGLYICFGTPPKRITGLDHAPGYGPKRSDR